MNREEHEIRIAELERRVSNIVRIGRVAETDYANALLRVDLGDVITDPIRLAGQRAGTDRSWWAPDLDEEVLVFSPDGDLAKAVVLGAIYSVSGTAPADSADVRRDAFGDGFVIEHDRSEKRTVLNAWDSEGTIEIRAKNIILKTGEDGFYHIDHAGLASRTTHLGGADYQSESWSTGANVTGLPDQGHNPPEVEI
jgi:phage baseplate assembly protein V